MSDENPFERWGIDPLGGPAAITERMRELVEDAPDEVTRQQIRAAWEQLTMHPADRLRAAFGAHPDTHRAIGAHPPAPPRRPAPSPSLSLAELLPRPRPTEALGVPEDAPLPDVDDDPLLR